ncbi:MAG: hypothetical protein H6711_04875 [Myxococcales bacterium]|nr:hypothetical protein [Myxococcales bacterium]
MSRERSPQVKKARSLARDRRNTYGECPTSARRSIRRRKRWSHHKLRQETRRELEREPLEASASAPQRPHWRKWPDEPLGEVLHRRRLRRFLNDLGDRIAAEPSFLERLARAAVEHGMAEREARIIVNQLQPGSMLGSRRGPIRIADEALRLLHQLVRRLPSAGERSR